MGISGLPLGTWGELRKLKRSLRDGNWEGLHVLGVAGSLVLLISGNVDDGAGGNGEIGIVLGVAGTDLRALGVESNGAGTAGVSGDGLAGIVNYGLVVLVGAVGEVHANDVETGIAETVDGLDRVGLGANGADDGGTAVVVLGAVGRVEGGQPGEATAADVEMILSSGSHERDGALTLLTLRHDEGGRRRRKEERGEMRDESGQERRSSNNN